MMMIKKISSIVMSNGYSISIIIKEVIDIIITRITNRQLKADKYALIFSELSNLESKFTSVVLPAPDGEDKIIIVPSLRMGMICLIGLTFYKFNSITYSKNFFSFTI